MWGVIGEPYKKRIRYNVTVYCKKLLKNKVKLSLKEHIYSWIKVFSKYLAGDSGKTYTTHCNCTKSQYTLSTLGFLSTTKPYIRTPQCIRTLINYIIVKYFILYHFNFIFWSFGICTIQFESHWNKFLLI